MVKTKRNDAYLRLHVSILMAGATGLFGRLITLTQLPLVWYRVMIAAVVLAIVLAMKRQLRLPQGRVLMQIAGCGVLLAVHWVFFYGSIKEANVSIGVVCFALVGFFTAVLEPLIAHHKPLWRELGLSLLTLAGIVLIFGLDSRYRVGIAMGVVSSLLYSLFSIYSKRVSLSCKQSSSTMLLYELVGGFVVLSMAIPVLHHLYPALPLLPNRQDIGYLLIFASLFTIGPFLLQLQALKSISAFTVNLSYNLEPIYSILLASLIFGEAAEMGLSFWIGVGMIVLSVAMQARLAKR